MKENKRASERGQVLVLIALGMVALLGFTALAIDGSMMYSDRRYGQNAGDASSLAGGGKVSEGMEMANITSKSFNCDIGDDTLNAVDAAIGYAITRAQDNGFVITQMDFDAVTQDSKNYVTYQCVNQPAEKHVDVIVEMEVETKTSFVQFVYKGPVVQRVRSVTRVRPRKFLAYGNAVVALNSTPCSGQQNGTGIHGGTGLVVQGGGLWSNGCMRVDGGGNPPPCNIEVYDGDINYFDGGENSDVDKICLEAGQTTNDLGDDDSRIEPDDYALDPMPNCNAANAHNVDLRGLTGGVLRNALKQFVNTTSPVQDLWCINGDVSLSSGDKIWGTNVTLYFIDGSLSLGGQANLDLTSVDPQDLAYNGPAILGVAIFSGLMPTDAMLNGTDPTPLCSIDITGGTESHLTGVVLAPACDIYARGNSNNEAYNSQIIGWNVEVGGAAMTNVIFDENKAYSRPTFIDLWR